jgi:alpha-1,2-mannosyltransferase
MLVVVVAGVSVLGLLAWLIAYDGPQRPFIFNSQYPSLLGSDLLARLLEENLARSGQNLYHSVSQGWYPYPPGAIFLFLPITYMPLQEAFAAWTQLSIACMAATYLVVLRATRRGPWLEHIAIATWACIATVLLLSPMDDTLALGQLSTILLLLVTLDVLAVHDRSQGFLVGLAMAFKLYPGVVVFFWLGRRQWRAAITALLTFTLVTAGAWAVWPHSSPWSYLRLLFGGGTLSILEEPGLSGRNASVTGFLFRLPVLSHSTAVALGTVASVIIAIVGIWVAVRLDRRGYPVTALVILLCTSVLISPLAWAQYFTFAPLLVFVIMEVGISSASGKLAALALACFAVPWVLYLRTIEHPTLVEDVRDLVSYNALFVAALVVMASGVLAARRAPAVETTEPVPDLAVNA